MLDSGSRIPFRGPFALHLMNLLRVIVRYKKTLALKVYSDMKEGTVFFDKGKLVHSELSGRSGEEAFSEIVSVRDGYYEKINDLHADVVSIERDAKFLLEHYKDSSAETKAESGDGLDDAAETGEEDEQSGETLKTEAPSQEPEASLQPSPNNEDKGFQEELWMKDWLSKHPECKALYVVREDGAIIMHALNDDSCLRPEAAIIHALLGSAKRLSNEGDSLSLYLETKTASHFFSSLGEGFFLAAIFDSSRSEISSVKKGIQPLIQALIHSLENA
ncbi:hypothetical protein GX441_04905 [bacterium]|nr:hypothetical protein [bacterium]